MARYKPGTGIDPLQGDDLGTTFQRGQFGSVIKSKSFGQGQNLPPFRASKVQLNYCNSLWRKLSSVQQDAWRTASASFPTFDRYGNPITSDGRHLFLRAAIRLPAAEAAALTVPDTPFADPMPVAATLTYSGGSFSFEPPPTTGSDNLNSRLFMSIGRSKGKEVAIPQLRSVHFESSYNGAPKIDVTAAYNSLFPEASENSSIFWKASTYKDQTPEEVRSDSGKIEIEPAPGYLIQQLSIDAPAVFCFNKIDDRAGQFAFRSRNGSTYFDFEWDGDYVTGNSKAYYASTGLDSGYVLNNFSKTSNGFRLNRWYNQADGGATYLDYGSTGFFRSYTNDWDDFTSLYVRHNAAGVAFMNAAISGGAIFPVTYYGYNKPSAVNNYSSYVRNHTPLYPRIFQRYTSTARYIQNGGTLWITNKRNTYAREMAIFNGVNSEYYLNNVLDVSGNAGSTYAFDRLGIGYYCQYQMQMALDGVPTSDDKDLLEDYFSTLYP